MENGVILLDTSVLIDYFRKKDKTKSFFFQLTRSYKGFAISSITYYEIYVGSNLVQAEVWDNLFDSLTIIPFDIPAAQIAAELKVELKKSKNLIDDADLFIAATPISNNLPCATLNTKHFNRITSLQLIGKE